MQSASTTAVELPEEAGGEPSATDGDLQAAEEDGAEENEMGEEEQDVPEEIVPPPPALKAVYAPGEGGRFLLALGTWARGAIFECSWKVTERLPRLCPSNPTKTRVREAGLPARFASLE